MSVVLKRLCASYGLVLAYCTILITLYTMYGALLDMPAPNRITISFLCFIGIFVITAFNQKLGIVALLFILPLLPNITMQILAFTGYGRILTQQTPGLDAIAGLLLGTIANKLWSRRQSGALVEMPWQAGLLMCVITASACLAITRNLHQSSSGWDLSILTFNLVHIRSLGWFHDYRPLVDWVAYGNAFMLIALMMPALKTMPNRNDVVFKPLCLGVIVAAVVGLNQSQTGRGLAPLQVFFRNDSLGFIALGFQPDIHAFAGQMLIGAIGTIGYLLYTQSRRTQLSIACCVMPLAWIGLVLSKSKASLALAIFSLLIIVLMWTLRRSTWLLKAVYVVLGAIVLICLSFYFFSSVWVNALTALVQKLGLADLSVLNHYMAYRPEIFMAGLRMFTEFPLMGLGQGDFYRLSANLGFSQSAFLSANVNGENAHNYFLQVLAETGLIGFSIFILLLVYPLVRAKNKVYLIPAAIGLASVCLGNVYSHSLLVRENLFVAGAFIALMYAWLAVEQKSLVAAVTTVAVAPSPADNIQTKQKYIHFFLILLLVIVSIFAAKEIYQSFKRFPFSSDNPCFIKQPLSEDGWTTGLYELRLDDGAQGVTVHIKSAPSSVVSNPLGMVMTIAHDTQGTMAIKEVVLSSTAPTSFDIRLPVYLHASGDFYKFSLKLMRCDSAPSNDPSANNRARGVQIESIEMQR